MTPADHYRKLAAELTAKARNEKSQQTKAEWAHLAQSYLRLAFQADKNNLTDIVYETSFRNGHTA